MSAPAVGALVAALLLAGGPGYATAQDVTTPEQPTLAEQARELVRVDGLTARGGAAECIETHGELACFKLWTGCASMWPIVLAGEAFGDVSNLVESRLRIARLYDPEAAFTLSVLVMPIPPAPGVRSENILNEVSLTFDKRVYDAFTGQWGFASLFTIERFWRGRGSGVVSKVLDEFLTEYLRVNEPAC